MKNELEQRTLERRANRHMYSRYRNHLRWKAGLIYLSFSVFDYIYAPQHFFLWLSLRVVFFLFLFISFSLISKYQTFRKKMGFFGGMALCLACWPIALFIYQTGGYLSLYATGLILCGTTGLQIFRMRKTGALVSLSLSFLPSIFVFYYSAPPGESHLATIQTGFLVGMVILSYVYGSSEEEVDSGWMHYKSLAENEIETLKKTEILKNHFPKIIRESFEKNPALIIQKKILHLS